MIEAYEENIIDIKALELLNLLKYTINLDIFQSTSRQENYVYELPSNKVLVPTLDLPTKQDTIYFYDRLLTFIFKSLDTLNSLFEIVKSTLLSQLYPSVWKEYTRNIETPRLIEPIPSELHEILVNKLFGTKDDTSFVQFMFSEKSYSLTFEILDITCSKLSIGVYYNVIDTCLDYYWDSLFNMNIFNIISECANEDDVIISFTSSLSHILSLNSTSKEVQQHSTLIKKVLLFYNTLTSKHSDLLQKDAWIFIQLLILDLSMQFIQKYDASKLDDNPTNIVNVADSIFECLIIIWIRSPFTTHEMWMDFMKKFSTTTDWPQAIRQWKKYTILVTHIMCRLYESESIELDDDLGLAWTQNLAEQVWFTLLNMIGNIRNIKSASNFQETLKCFAEMISILSEEEKKGTIPYDSSSFKVFLPWIIEACYAKGESARGVVIALPVLCNLFFKNSGKQLPIEVLSHFYHAILFTLKSEYAPVSGQTLIEIKTLFAQDLPYSSIMMYDVLLAIENIFRPKYAAPIEVQKSGALLLNSFISLFEQFNELESLSLESQKPSYLEANNKKTSLIMSLSSNTLVDEAVKNIVASNLCVGLINEITKEEPIISDIHKYFKTLLTMISSSSDQAAISASNSLRDLSCLFERLNKIDVNIAYSIISTVSNMCCSLIKEGLNNGIYREKLIISLLELISYWITAGPSHLMKSKDLASSVFNLVEYGLFGCKVNLKEESERPQILSEEEILTLPNYHLILKYYSKPKHLSIIIRDASEALLNSILNFYNKFPMPSGITLYDKHITELKEVKTSYFIDDRNRIMSLQQIRKEDSTDVVRIISRSSTGKYAWSSTIDYGSDISRKNDYIDPLPVGTIPQDKVQPKRSDILTSVLMKFNELHMSCLPKSPKFFNFTTPIQFTDERKILLTNIENKINNSVEEEKRAIENYVEYRSNIENDMRIPVKPKTTNQLSRLLLNHFGFLSPQSRRTFYMLQESEELLSLIEKLDDTPVRKQLSSLIVYMKDDNLNIEESFKIKEISKLYYEFLSGLGNFVDLDQHNGYKSNISSDNAQYGVYYSNIFEEIFFIPSNECKNEEFFQKMLHEQNLIIIWNEGYKDIKLSEYMEHYQSDCIIEISTLSNGLFGIKIITKNIIEQEGPLFNGSVVTKRILPITLRLTCINICRQLYNEIDPFESRKMIIKNIYENSSKQYPGNILIDELFHTKAIQELISEEQTVNEEDGGKTDIDNLNVSSDELPIVNTDSNIFNPQEIENTLDENDSNMNESNSKENTNESSSKENINESDSKENVEISNLKPTISLSKLPQLSQMNTTNISPTTPNPKNVPLAFLPKVPTQHHQ